MTDDTMGLILQTFDGRECVLGVNLTVPKDDLSSILELCEYMRDTTGRRVLLKHVMGTGDTFGICQQWEYEGMRDECDD